MQRAIKIVHYLHLKTRAKAILILDFVLEYSV
jgi:hypothetical protein